MSVADKILALKQTIPASTKLVAVSKFHPVEAIKEAYNAGQQIFGESKMQELDEKCKQLPSDIEWHFIGHLQRNKVKNLIPYLHTIHSMDSVRLFNEIVKQADSEGRVVCCLLQLHVADEDTKYGFTFEECRQFLAKGDWKTSKYAYIGGVMGMATNTDDEILIRSEFRSLKLFFDEIKKNYFADDDRFKEISMGMSGDYQLAIEEGSTMVRVGSSIFGERQY